MARPLCHCPSPTSRPAGSSSPTASSCTCGTLALGSASFSSALPCPPPPLPQRTLPVSHDGCNTDPFTASPYQQEAVAGGQNAPPPGGGGGQRPKKVCAPEISGPFHKFRFFPEESFSDVVSLMWVGGRGGRPGLSRGPKSPPPRGQYAMAWSAGAPTPVLYVSLQHVYPFLCPAIPFVVLLYGASAGAAVRAGVRCRRRRRCTTVAPSNAPRLPTSLVHLDP